MNMETLKSKILNCQEAKETSKIVLTKGEQYLLTEVFYPFYREPQNVGTYDLDFSAFTQNELWGVYNCLDEVIPLYPAIVSNITIHSFINAAEPFCAESAYI